LIDINRKFKAKKCVYIPLLVYLLLGHEIVLSEVFHYKMHWGFFPLAEVVIKINEANSPIRAEFNAKSTGPSHFLRSYTAKASITKLTDESYIYDMNGLDNNKIERRLIEYSSNAVPIIYDFIDDKGAPSLKINDIDKGAVDPFSVMLNIMIEIKNSKSCNGFYSVFDGKRRYKVKAEFIGYINLTSDRKWTVGGETVHCRINLIKENKDNIDIGVKNKLNQDGKNEWPLEYRNMRTIDTWFALNKNYQPIKFVMKATLGKVKGRLVQ
tara:strand:- start:1461 stop:2264 length:804 start_codon:yes stop_codon:yes gene_type:complete